MIEIDAGPHLVSGFLTLSWHGIFSLIAVATAVYLVGRWAPLRGIDPDAIYSIAVWGIIGGIVGARAVHVIDQWELYENAPFEMFAIWQGGIGVWGGILGGFLAAAAYALVAKHPVGIISDMTAPALLLAQATGRIGDIVNGEHCASAAGHFLSFVWTAPESGARGCSSGHAIHASGTQPVIALEMAWDMIALAIVWQLRGRLRPDGMLFAVYLALYSIGRFMVTFLRQDKIWALGMQEAQYIAILVLIITVPLLAAKGRFMQRVEAEPVVVDSRTRAQRRRG